MKSKLILGLVAIAFIGSGFLAQAEAAKIAGKVEAKREKFRKDAVVFIDRIEGKEFAVPEETVLMDQVNLTFVPHVLPVLVGSTVSFKNSDNVLHNVFTPDKCAEKFNLGSWPQNETREYTFTEPGCSAVMLCNVHPEMEAFVLVLQNPYYSVTDKEGTFLIEDLPPGEYELRVWHKKLKAESQKIKVAEGDSLNVSFTLKR